MLVMGGDTTNRRLVHLVKYGTPLVLHHLQLP